MNKVDKVDKVYVVTAGEYEDYHIVDENIIKKLICDTVAKFKAEELGRYD